MLLASVKMIILTAAAIFNVRNELFTRLQMLSPIRLSSFMDFDYVRIQIYARQFLIAAIFL